MKNLHILFCVFLLSCSSRQLLVKSPVTPISGSAFYTTAISFNWQQRDSMALVALLDGNMPKIHQKFVPIHTSITDANHKIIHATYFVMPDYLSIGTNQDWARIPLTPMAAQRIADSLHCFLPTKKMVDEIYVQSKVKLVPVPMYAYRDSTVTMWQHHLIIEGQRKGQKGLIAGIKKDVVLSNIVFKGPKTNKVAIYGWHQLNGKAIQPLYAGHVNWYVDYSHGIRLIMDQIIVDGKKMHYKKVLLDPNLRALLSDEQEPMLRY